MSQRGLRARLSDDFRGRGDGAGMNDALAIHLSCGSYCRCSSYIKHLDD